MALGAAEAAPFESARAAAVTDSAAADTSSRAPSKQTRPKSLQPRWVMLRSLVVPGWGQATNGAWLKAGGVAAGEVTLIARVVEDMGALNDLEAAVNAARAAGDEEQEIIAVAAYNDKLDETIRHQWFLGALIAYAMADAYVDAHFRYFKIEFERDPALPAGRPGDLGVRVGWELRF